jgi:serine protease inhibitor ecotin
VTSPNYACPEGNKEKTTVNNLNQRLCVWQTVKLVVVVYMLIDDDLDVADTLELEPGGKFECIR